METKESQRQSEDCREAQSGALLGSQTGQGNSRNEEKRSHLL